MRSRSTLWEQLTKRGRFELETKAQIGDVEYTAISAPVIDRTLMSSPLSVGNCPAATLALSILTTDEIAASSPVVIYGRVNDGASYSEWKEFGTFFINQRDTSYEGLVTLSCYDAMLKASQTYVDGSGEANWPKPMTEVVDEIAYRIGVSVDDRTVINTGDDYMVPYPTGLSMLQVLGYIGACHGGNWVVTEENKLRLIPLVTSPDETFYVIDPDYEKIQTDDGYTLIHDIQTVFNTVLPGETPGLINVPVVLGQITTGTPVTVTGIVAEDSEGNSYTAGDFTGEKIDLGQNPYVTQAICDALLENFAGLVYSPYTASKAIYDPATELGDQVKIGDKVFSVIMAETLTLDLSFGANISAPNSEELSDEYPYLSEVERLKQTATELNAAIEAASKELAETVETATGDVESLKTVLQAEVERASSVEKELATRIESEESRAKQAEAENANGIKALLDDVTSLKDTTSNQDTRLTALESASSGVSGDVSGLAARVTANETSIKALQDKNVEQDTSISTMNSLVGSHATRILALENANTQNTTDISELKTDVAGIKTNVSALQGTVDALQGAVETQNTNISALQTSDQAQAEALTALQTALEGINTQLGNIQSAIKGIEERLTALEGSVSGEENA